MSKKKAVLGTSPEEVLAPMAVCLQLVRGPYKVSYHAKGQKCFLVDHWIYMFHLYVSVSRYMHENV